MTGAEPPNENPAASPAGVQPVPPGAIPPVQIGIPHVQMPFGAIMAHQAVSWQGPFPPPDAVERYEQVSPGAFDRILGMAERAEAARITDTRQAQIYLHSDIRRGHWLGFAATAAAMICAVVAVIFGQPWVAAAFLSVPVMSVGKALIDSSRPGRTAEPPRPAAAAEQPPGVG